MNEHMLTAMAAAAVRSPYVIHVAASSRQLHQRIDECGVAQHSCERASVHYYGSYSSALTLDYQPAAPPVHQ
jgi:hypothetical protein